jgi:hypothetical protein
MHDIFYRDHKDNKERHIADKELANIINERMYKSDASNGENISSELVRTIMICKAAFGKDLYY